MGRRIEIVKFDRLTGEAMLTQRNIVTKAYYKAVKCKFCGDWESIVQYGRTASGTQRYLCRHCKRTFLDNKAPERMQFSVDVIASGINQFYESASLHKIARQIKLDYGVAPNYSTVYLWVVKYTKLASQLLTPVTVKVGDVWVADETVIGLKQGHGENIWVWDIICDTTRFLLASHLSETRKMQDARLLMERAEKRAMRIPRVVITDKLRSYLDAIERTWGADTTHLQSSPFIQGRGSTRSIERLHGTLKDRTRVMRSLMDKRTAKVILDGWYLHYNFFRPHQGLGGRTPAGASEAQTPLRSWADVVRCQ